MMTKSKGKKSKTRKKLRKNVKERGKFPTRKMIQELSVGSKVSIEIDPSIHKGQPHPKFYGRTGTVSGKQGRAYVINLKGENKKVISRPEHLKRVRN
ncbi:50S ribosomal protein L21 [candidate division MSBL1 archaeon SCGC-AAA259A05]|uniref:Large ribosomal subunit protein eL21 n=1 Tax=candidate division MSBL1 archaeon SCGC-AAA259A05 TaxID=1698259 RepID=A0A133UBS5_9EURY|nr:50S ribosomal protein L21 [candidate division MSBL1 archaeon SCGC-AAA259A05]